MGLVIPIIAISIAVATFIENDFGAETARAHIYNATWFEALFVLAAINLLGSMVLHKVYRKGKLSILLFHLSFLMILLGAGITRYLGFTGMMHIREGDRSSLVLSDESWINMQVLDGDKAFRASKRIYLSDLMKSGRVMKVRTGTKQTIRVDYLDHMSHARPALHKITGGAPAILLVSSSPEGRDYHPFYKQESRWISGQLFQFNQTSAGDMQGIRIHMNRDRVYFTAPYPVGIMRMTDHSQEMLEAHKKHELKPMAVYSFGSLSIVLSEKESSAEVLAVKQEDSEGNGKTALSLRFTAGSNYKDITLWGAKGLPGQPRQIQFSEREILLTFGSIARSLPFSLELEDFILDRYPGSSSPSSFESRVLLRDDEKNLQASHRIYMNHILNYRGYRFYQSSYDTDEKGSVLSVNKDHTGTLITYIGYFLLSLGIILSLINPNSRFRKLNMDLTLSGKKKAVLTLLLTAALCSGNGTKVLAAEDSQQYEIPASHAREFGKLLIQDPQGRIKPMNTLSSEILRKVSRKTSLNGMGSDQVLLGMLADPVTWQNVSMIRISHPGITELLSIKGKHASFMDFVDPELEGGYKIIAPVMLAHRLKPAERSKFDTEILRVDERNNICFMVYDWTILRILPDSNDEDQAWHNPSTIKNVYSGADSLFAVNITQLYFESVREGMSSGDWNKADEYLGYIKVFQNRMGSKILPSELKQKAEILYNRVSIFDRLARFYMAIGMSLLIILLVQILGKKERLKKLRKIMVIHLLAGFGVHSVGLILRWYISGHAPWSNGYEALIYISWASMLAGVLFSRRTAAPLAVTAVLSWMILHTAHLSWMDPQLTNLVPVLKSYWLTIHVAVIASSYGFMGLAALLGFMNLLLMGLQNRGNRNKVETSVESLTAIIEMTIIAGLGLLTIGTFLGGVWANESWGRYWAWDPKESWALITILVYAFISHMRFIPGMKGIYPLNLAAVLGFTSVIMTYFGVNYYLSGMHSYAAGDPVPVPDFVYWTLGIIALLSITAWIRNKRMERVAE
jgi:cytochrome c-type biogenesis protein CcsB